MYFSDKGRLSHAHTKEVSLSCLEKEGLSHAQRKDVFLMLCHSAKFTLGFGVCTGLTQSLNM